MNFLNENCPFVHDRDFRGIMLSSPSLDSFDKISKLFFESTLGSGEAHGQSTDSFKIEHRFYFTAEDFTNNLEDRSACRGKWKGQKYSFRYSIFFARMAGMKSNVFLIILPLMKMARNLYPKFEEKARGRDVTYWCVDLWWLIEKFKAGNSMNESMSLKSIRYAVLGDTKTSGFEVLGSDTATSKTLKLIETSLKKTGIRYKPRVVDLMYSNLSTGERFCVNISRLGHLKFFLNQGTSNFPMLGTILGYLSSLKLFQETSFPPFRWPDEKEVDNEDRRLR